MAIRRFSKWVQGFVALIGAIILGYLGMVATEWLCYAYLVRQPFHSPQDGETIVDSGLAIGLLLGILSFSVLLILQRRVASGTSPN